MLCPQSQPLRAGGCNLIRTKMTGSSCPKALSSWDCAVCPMYPFTPRWHTELSVLLERPVLNSPTCPFYFLSSAPCG